MVFNKAKDTNKEIGLPKDPFFFESQLLSNQ